MTFADEVLDDALASILRQKTPTERLAIGFRLWTFAQEMLRANLRRDHPEWDEAELRPKEVEQKETKATKRGKGNAGVVFDVEPFVIFVSFCSILLFSSSWRRRSGR